MEASVCDLGVMPKRKGIQTAGKIEMFGKPGPKLVIITATALSPVWGKQAGHEISDLWDDPLAAAQNQIWMLPGPSVPTPPYVNDNNMGGKLQQGRKTDAD